MHLGIDSFVSAVTDPSTGRVVGPEERIEHLLEEIALADQVGLYSFGIGEHHRPEYYDSAPPVILAAAAARTSRIRLGSAVAVLSASDPVRVFQQFATLDLISKGRIDLVVGRGSFTEAFPLFGLSLADYDELFEEKLDLLLRIRASEKVTWSGRHRPPLTGQGVYPRPLQDPLPIWVGVGGTPESFVRAGLLGLPLMVAIIGGEPRQFGPLVDLYRRAGAQAGHAPETLKVACTSSGSSPRARRQRPTRSIPAGTRCSPRSRASAASRRRRGPSSTRPAAPTAPSSWATPTRSRPRSVGCRSSSAASTASRCR
jgi:alkanesulfonate monooxygenase SsuD/methylene tetrahydromethanopterin reductase-like flavin-dependent oxidoreductase (luciferase family)